MSIDYVHHPHPRFALHGYAPLIVDGELLSPEQVRACLLEGMRSREDVKQWRRLLTGQERQELEQRIAALNAEAHGQGYLDDGEAHVRDGTYALLWTAERTAYARRELNAGRAVWWGDGRPGSPSS